MNKILPLFLLLFFLLSGCIEIIEEITLHNDNSGNIKYRIQTDQFGSIVNSLNDFIDVSIENQIKSKIEDFSFKLKNLEGIDSVKFNLNGKSDNSLLTFSFANPAVLNAAIYSMIGYKKNLFSPKYITITNHNFRRKNFSPWIKKYLNKENIEIPVRELISMVAYKTVIHYPVRVKKYKGKNLEITVDRMKITQRNRLRDVLDDKTNVSIKSRQ